MREHQSQDVRLISKLTQLTAMGELDWKALPPPEALLAGTNDICPIFYGSSYRGQDIGLAIRRFRQFDGERDIYYWCEEYVLLFLDNYGRITWDARDHYSALNVLFEAVRANANQLGQVFNRLLADEDPSL